MGIFDKLKGSKTIQLTPKSALVAAAISVIASDGVLDEAELGDLAKIARGDKSAVNDAVQVLENNSIQETMDLVAKCLNEKQRMAAMVILLDLSMADGILAGNEQKILQQYMEKFGISETAIKPLIDTIALKNDFSIFS
ncbi:MAG: Tellurite resistance protein TerB [Euryarchaeota archaeon ADurb.BinA087]|nr:MAG: Tellurite resistance protein TerB [Euryarchaeota archaeon ADurb.BinA087]HPX72448.1 tellurite resistance TerB family protein [Methanoregulaceae archaeon]HQA79773.1 tellurite resistance TerB family protein [Methanoregulaceae archaeon]